MNLLRRSGELATASLLVSIGSGLAVAFHYEAGDPFAATVAIDAVLPFGAFLRSLHFWSSQTFFLLLCLHAWHRLADLVSYRQRENGAAAWAVLTLTLPMTILALFTGYVLRWDATGQAAGIIAENLLKGIPIAGEGLNRMLVAVSDEGANRVYAVHLALTALLLGIGTWYHTRRVILSPGYWNMVLLPLMAFTFLVDAPLERMEPELILIKGPWFFLGVQELLRYLPPLLAGILIPLVPVALLGSLPLARDSRPLLKAILIWCAAYALPTFVIWLR